jgi:hypothetical protein
VKLKTLVGLATQLAFGVDTLIGLGTYVILSFVFQEPLNVWFLIWAGFYAYLPDFDLAIYKCLSRENKKWGHWRIGFHHPILFLPLSGVVTWGVSAWMFPSHELFLTTLSLTCVFGHFVHDSMGEAGLHWFSPFKKGWWRRWNPLTWVTMNPLEWAFLQVTKVGIRIVPQSEVVVRYERTARIAEAGNDIEARLEKVKIAHIACFIACVVGLVAQTLAFGFVF